MLHHRAATIQGMTFEQNRCLGYSGHALAPQLLRPFSNRLRRLKDDRRDLRFGIDKKLCDSLPIIGKYLVPSAISCTSHAALLELHDVPPDLRNYLS